MESFTSPAVHLIQRDCSVHLLAPIGRHSLADTPAPDPCFDLVASLWRQRRARGPTPAPSAPGRRAVKAGRSRRRPVSLSPTHATGVTHNNAHASLTHTQLPRIRRRQTSHGYVVLSPSALGSSRATGAGSASAPNHRAISDRNRSRCNRNRAQFDPNRLRIDRNRLACHRNGFKSDRNLLPSD